MARKTYIKAHLVFHQKLTVIHRETSIKFICELKAWRLPKSKKYPLGIKYSLFCVDINSGEVVIGFDNHYPKGPHMHLDRKEIFHEFKGLDLVVKDFWSELKDRGYS